MIAYFNITCFYLVPNSLKESSAEDEIIYILTLYVVNKQQILFNNIFVLIYNALYSFHFLSNILVFLSYLETHSFYNFVFCIIYALFLWLTHGNLLMNTSISILRTYGSGRLLKRTLTTRTSGNPGRVGRII